MNTKTAEAPSRDGLIKRANEIQAEFRLDAMLAQTIKARIIADDDNPAPPDMDSTLLQQVQQQIMPGFCQLLADFAQHHGARSSHGA